MSHSHTWLHTTFRLFFSTLNSHHNSDNHTVDYKKYLRDMLDRLAAGYPESVKGPRGTPQFGACACESCIGGQVSVQHTSEEVTTTPVFAEVGQGQQHRTAGLTGSHAEETSKCHDFQNFTLHRREVSDPFVTNVGRRET